MKKFISLIMAISLVFSIACIASAAENDTNANVFYYGEKEIIVEGQDLSYTQMKKVADYVAGEHSLGDISVKGISCSLFGHKITKSSVTEITHNVYSTSPKCVEKIYKVSSCSKCDYIDKTLERTTRIRCH